MRVSSICLIFLSCGLLPSAARAEFESPLVITNAKIVTAPGHVIESGTIVIENGRIVAVGARVETPPQAELIDASGLVIYPGFIDAGTHAGIKQDEPNAEKRARVEDENPDVRDGPQSATVQAYRRLMHPSWRAEDLYVAKNAKLDDSRRGGFTTALVTPHPAIFSGHSAVIQLGDEPLRRSLLKTDFAQHAMFTTGKGGSSYNNPSYPTTTMGAMAAFRQIMLDAAWHRDLTAWSRRHPDGDRVPLDRDLEALWALTDGLRPVVFIANSENEIHRALDMAAEFGLKPIIAGAREGWRTAARLKSENVSVILSLKWSEDPLKKKKSDKKKKAAEKEPPTTRTSFEPLFDKKWEEQTFEPLKLIKERRRLWKEEVNNARLLHEAGVRFAIGSFEMQSPKEVIKHLAEAIKQGLPEEAALAALTTDAAEILGVADQMGEIAPNRLANLTVLTKPLSDKKAEVHWLFVEGKRFDLSTKKKDKKHKAAKKDGNDDEDDEKDADDQDEKEPTLPTDAPSYRCEIESDRRPGFQTDGNLLIKNATLLTITGDDLPQTDLLIRDGKIAAIGPNLNAPGGVRTIDLSGYYVMPGMIDPHSHMCSDGGLNEHSLSVTTEVRVRDVVDHRDIAAFRALAGGVTTIHTMHGSANAMGGQNAVLRLKYGRPASEWLFKAAPRTVKFALGENVKQSNFGTKGKRFPNTRMGVEAVMRRSFDAARLYQQEWADYRKSTAAGTDPRPLRHDLRLEALSEIVSGNIWVHTHCYRADEVLRLLTVAEDYGFRIGVLQHILEGYRVIPEILRHGCGTSTFSDWWGYKIEAYNAIPHNASRMTQGGVIATVNSDSGEVIRHMNLEAAKSMRFGGLSPNDALRLVTINGAVQLGIASQVGSIEEGKLADLAVFDGHPLDTLAKCVLTLIDGKTYFQHEALDIESPAAPRGPKQFVEQRASLDIAKSNSGDYWIVGGTVHPITGDPIEDGVLAISDGLISRVGPRAGTRPPAGATIVNVTGLHVYPGLINAGTSLGLIEISSVAGSVDVADIAKFQPDLSVLSAYDPFGSAVEVSRSEGVTTALVIPGGRARGVRGPAARLSMVAGQAGLVHLDGWSMPEARLQQSAGLLINIPSLPIDHPRKLNDEQKKKDKERKEKHRKQLIELEEFFRSARRYASASKLAEDQGGAAPEPDRRLQAMMPYVRGEAPVFITANSYKQIREALKFADHFKLKAIIHGGREAWKLAGELVEAKVGVVLVRSMSYPGSKFEPWDSVYQSARVLHEAGVRFCFATGGASLVKQLGIEAGMAVAHGLDPDAALQAITIDAARIVGMGNRLGSLEVGKVADVIVTTDTPLQASCGVVASFINGRPVDLSNKHTRLDDKFRSRPKPILPAERELVGPPPMRRGDG